MGSGLEGGHRAVGDEGCCVEIPVAVERVARLAHIDRRGADRGEHLDEDELEHSRDSNPDPSPDPNPEPSPNLIGLSLGLGLGLGLALSPGRTRA